MRPLKTFAALCVLCLFADAVFAEAILKLHLDFNEGRAEVVNGKHVIYDKVGKQRAELVNTKWVNGKSAGKALLFNGKLRKDGGSCVILPDSQKDPFLCDFDNGPFTIEVWFKSDAEHFSKRQDILNTAGDRGPGYRLGYVRGALYFLSGSGKLKSDGTGEYWALVMNSSKHKVLGDTWNHIAVVKDNRGFLTLYLNGKVVAKSKKSFPVTKGDVPITIGAFRMGYAYPAKGILDDLRIYKGARTAAEMFKPGRTDAEIEASRKLKNGVTLNLDGKLDDAIWKNAKRFSSFRRYKTDTPATVQTTVLMANDAQYLYFGFIADEPLMGRIKDNVQSHTLGVYADDCVEILLDADGNPSDYYRFCVNPSGFRGQEMRVQCGHLSDTWNNGNWLAVTAKEKDKWTAEIAIPFAILNREKGLIGAMRFNAARNRRADAAAAGGIVKSSAAGGVFNKPYAKFMTYNAAGVDFSPYLLRTSEPALADVRMDNGKLHVVVALNLKNLAKKATDVGLLARLVSPKSNICASEVAVSLQAGKEEPLSLSFELDKPGKYRLLLFVQRNGDILFASEDAMSVEFEMLSMNVTRPFYRNNIYATQAALKEIRATVRIGLTKEKVAGSVLRLELKNGIGRMISEEVIRNPALKQDAALPVSALAMGKYRLVATLWKQGNILAETTETIRKLPKATGREVRIDEKLRMVLDGKPILPIVWWGGAPLKEMAGAGGDGIVTGFSRNSRPALDKLHSVGQMGCIMLMNSASFNRLMKNQTEFTQEMREYVTDAVKAVKDHPAMLVWYLADEPEASALSPNLLRSYYELIRELDPYHPIMITNYRRRALYTYADCHDMFTPDPYILPIKGGGLERSMSRLVAFMKNAQQAGAGRKLIGLTPQIFNFGDYSQRNGRAPTFTEQRCMQFIAIVHGTRYFSYYIYKGMKGYPDLALGVPLLMKEIRAVTPMILYGEAAQGVTVADPAIHLTAMNYKGNLFIIACNVEPRTISTKIGLPEGVRQLKVVSELRRINIGGTQFSDTFIPYGVHIYTTDQQFKSQIMLKEVEETVKAAGGMHSLTYHK